jgi:hypothetical protein
MLPVVVALAVVTAARVRVWRVAEGSHPLTLAQLAFTVAGFMFLPEVGERLIDPQMWWGANLSTLVQHLGMVAGFYVFGAVGLADTKMLKYWKICAIATAIVHVITYRTGPQYSTPATEFGLDGTSDLIGQATLLAFSAVTCVILMAHALAGIRSPQGRELRKSMAALFGVAVTGLCWALTTGALLAFDPEFVRASYHDLTSVWAFPAFLALAGAGVPGFVSAWRRRHDPSRRRRRWPWRRIVRISFNPSARPPHE